MGRCLCGFTKMKAVAYGLILVGLSTLWLLRDSDPLLKLAAASILLLFFVKVAALLWQLSDGLKPKSKLGMAIYFLALPFVMYTGFEETAPHPPPETGHHFLKSWMMALAGCALLLVSAYVGRGK